MPRLRSRKKGLLKSGLAIEPFIDRSILLCGFFSEVVRALHPS
jgi:hypothetical protein